MSSESDEEYASADEAANTSSGGGQCKLQDQEPKELKSHSDVSASASNVEQPDVVKVVDNKYVSDAESMKNGGLVELSEEQRKVCACVFMYLSILSTTTPVPGI